MSAGLKQRRFFVTGAAKGIGRACVERLIGAGAKVACFDRDADALSAFEAGSGMLKLHGDVAQSASVNAAVDKAAADLGGLDGLISCAGIDLVSSLEETSDEAWRRIFAVNLDGAMHLCRAGLPHLRQAGGGTIVNVSSAAGLQPLKHRSAYSASKAALQMFSKALAMEAAEYGVRVNTVCPGAVETELLRSSMNSAPDLQAARDAVSARYALARIADPDEIAAAVVWLSGPDSSYVTGTAMAVDGGRTFH